MPQNFLSATVTTRCSCRRTCATGPRGPLAWFVIEEVEELALEPF